MHVRHNIWITVLLCMVWYVGGQHIDIDDIPAVRLYRNLTENYVKQVPVVNYNDTLQVYTIMRLFQLLNLDSSSETMAVTGEFIFTWKDAFLKWSLDEYPDVLSLSIPANQVFTQAAEARHFLLLILN